MIIHDDLEQGTPAWDLLRSGMPTASSFKEMITPTGIRSKSLDKYARKLAGDLFAGEPIIEFHGTKWTRRGHELEEIARLNYEMIFDIDTVQVGFVTDGTKRKKPTYGCSPDSMVADDGLVEIKCLKAENHMDAIDYYDEHGTVPPEFVAQTQGQMFVCQREWVDLVFYHPKLPMITIPSKKNTRIQHSIKKHLSEVIELRDDFLETLNKYK